ncbi:hypothetical protein ICL81_01455 [Leucobacter sp. cx-328]|uniref:zinc-dependent metalloprotease family protein n=1 Tax=unclassified Leucobacter TaxID=2621730 RepID=UPI00165E96E9|nr:MULTISPECIES: zinc-dependent metalloprotease family protein [unclassified Leucobacter]MBC9943196.1 hypothetical protein [Leucobacter sp. cx-328]
MNHIIARRISQVLAIGVIVACATGSALPGPPLMALQTTRASAATDNEDRFEVAAANVDRTREELKALEEDGVIEVMPDGFVFAIDPALSPEVLQSQEFADVIEADGAPADGAVAVADIPGTPETGSRPDAPVTIFLNFDGAYFERQQWNLLSNIERIWFEPASMATTEFRYLVWARVAEDYAPFNVNVTTTRPSDDDLFKTSVTDDRYGAQAVITDTYTDTFPHAKGTGGLAFLGGAGSRMLTGALVFTKGAIYGGMSRATAAKNVAELVSHEIGHNFGVMHDGFKEDEYYRGRGGVWAPIMGSAYPQPITQWSNGEYAHATNHEDDLALITDSTAIRRGLMALELADGTPVLGGVCRDKPQDPWPPKSGQKLYLPNASVRCDDTGERVFPVWHYLDRADFITDEVGNNASTAWLLGDIAEQKVQKGVIITRDDVDVYRFETSGGTLTALAQVAAIGPNLHSKLALINACGQVLAEGHSEDLNSDITVALRAGTYFLTVEGIGYGDPSQVTRGAANAYSDYGSIGNYTLIAQVTHEVDPGSAPLESACVGSP